LSGASSQLSPFVDKLTIETPEQTSLDFVIAGIGSRFVAVALDILIQTAVGGVIGLVLILVTIGVALPRPDYGMWGAAALILFFFVLYFGYFAIFEIIWNGQTPGKRITKIRVIKDSGRPLTPAETIGRNLMRIVDSLPSCYAIGIVTMLLNKQNKRLGDLLVEGGYATRDQLREALTRQSSELVYELLRWPRGRFEFRPEEPPAVATNAGLGLPVASVVMEGFRRVDEWRLVEGRLGSFDSVLLVDAAAVQAVGVERLAKSEQKLLEMIDGERSVRDIVEESHMSSFDACKILFQLLEARLVRRRPG